MKLKQDHLQSFAFVSIILNYIICELKDHAAN